MRKRHYNNQRRLMMQRKDNRLDFSGQEIYVGLDTGKKSWKVTILTT
jgi:hypothetical protein